MSVHQEWNNVTGRTLTAEEALEHEHVLRVSLEKEVERLTKELKTETLAVKTWRGRAEKNAEDRDAAKADAARLRAALEGELKDEPYHRPHDWFREKTCCRCESIAALAGRGPEARRCGRDHACLGCPDCKPRPLTAREVAERVREACAAKADPSRCTCSFHIRALDLDALLGGGE